MKLSCLQENLSLGISIVGHIALKGTSLPILSNVLLQAEKNSLKLSATNLEAGVQHIVRGKIETEGECLVPAKLLLELLPLLAGGPITLEKNNEGITITTETTTTTLRTNPSTDFPIIPSVEEQKGTFILEAKTLQSMLQSSAFAAGRVEQRPQFSGVLVFVDKGKVLTTATDGYRLAETTTAVIKHEGQTLKFIIPIATVNEVTRILGLNLEDDEANISVNDNQVKIVIGQTEITSRLVDGEYPDYQPLFPQEDGVVCIIKTNALIRAIKATTLFSRAGLSDVSMKVTRDGVDVFSENGEVGSHRTTVPAKILGDETTALLNARYLLDGLAALSCDNAKLQLTKPDRPVFVRPAEDSHIGFKYLIMPIRQ